MKKAAAIFLIVVFAFSQYARQLAYIKCKLANAVSSSQLCDCERKYNIYSKDKKIPVALQSPFHPAIDEFYSVPAGKLVITSFSIHSEEHGIFSAGGTCEGNALAPYRPPQD